jgi:hypothetical protein
MACALDRKECVRAVNRWDIKVNRSGLDEMG